MQSKNVGRTLLTGAGLHLAVHNLRGPSGSSGAVPGVGHAPLKVDAVALLELGATVT